MLDFDELQEFSIMSSSATKSDFICDLMGTQNHQKNLVLYNIARFTMYGYWMANGLYKILDYHKISCLFKKVIYLGSLYNFFNYFR